METTSPNREAKRAARPTVLGSRSFGKLAVSIGLLGSVLGCQLGTRAPLNLPPGLGSPHSSSFKPDTTSPASGASRAGASATNAAPNNVPASSAQESSNYTARVRGQSPDNRYNNGTYNGTFGNSDPSRRSTSPADAFQSNANSRYTGQSTLAPGSGSPGNPPQSYAPFPNNPGGAAKPNPTNIPSSPPSSSPRTIPSGLVSTPAGVQPPLYTAQQGNPAPQGYGSQPSYSNSVPQTSTMQAPTGGYQQQNFQQPPIQLQPGYQQPIINYQQPVYQQPAFDPYATTQANTPTTMSELAHPKA